MSLKKILKRDSVVDGKFYPSSKEGIEKMIQRAFLMECDSMSEYPDINPIGGILPHAGYMYSLNHSIHLFDLLQKSNIQYDTVVIVNPDHHGEGDNVSVDGHIAWKTPLGEIEVDCEMAEAISFPKSLYAQRYEHSAEVIIPLIQHFMHKDVKILPISMKEQTYHNSLKLANEIYCASGKFGRKVLFIASSDFSHYVTPEYGYSQDELVVNEILELNGKNVYQKVKENNISMCGYGPVMSLIEYSSLVSEEPKSILLRRGHSGEAHPSNEVVDYISFAVYS